MSQYQVSLSKLPDFAKAFASAIKPGDVLGLNGGLGAGKTTFTKHLCQQWGIDPHEVTSPTYVYHHQYKGDHWVDHMDLYRLEDDLSLDQLGLRECIDTPSIVLVEWMNKFPEFTSTYMQIDITILNEDQRLFDVSWADGSVDRITAFQTLLAPWKVTA